MWRPISEHMFPWEPARLTVAAYAQDDPDIVEVFVCTCADHGFYYPDSETIPLALDEQGWVPFAWTDAPPESPEPR